MLKWGGRRRKWLTHIFQCFVWGEGGALVGLYGRGYYGPWLQPHLQEPFKGGHTISTANKFRRSLPPLDRPLHNLRPPGSSLARSLKASMAKLHSSASSCVETGNALIADHSRSICKLTEPSISEAGLLRSTRRAPSSFLEPFFKSGAKSASTEQRCWNRAAPLTNPQPHERANRGETSERYSYLASPELWNAFKLFKSVCITLLALLFSWKKSGAQWGRSKRDHSHVRFLWQAVRQSRCAQP